MICYTTIYYNIQYHAKIICTRIYVCIYIYIYMYTHTYTFTYIHMLYWKLQKLGSARAAAEEFDIL